MSQKSIRNFINNNTIILKGLLSLIFDLNQLIDMLSIGTLLAYSVVSVCVVILRYRPPKKQARIMPIETGHINEGQIIEEVPPIYLPEEKAFEEIESNISLFTRLFKPPSSFPTKHTSYLVNILCVLAG